MSQRSPQSAHPGTWDDDQCDISASLQVQQTQLKIFLGQTCKNAELQTVAVLAHSTTDVKYWFSMELSVVKIPQ